MLGGVMNQMAGHLSESRAELQEALGATERRNRELRLLSEVGDALDSALDLEAIIERSLAVILPAFALCLGAVDPPARPARCGTGPAAEPRAGLCRDPRAVHCEHTIARGLGRRPATSRRTAVQVRSSIPMRFEVPTRWRSCRWRPPCEPTVCWPWSPGRAGRPTIRIGSCSGRSAGNWRARWRMCSLYVAEKGRSAEAGMLAQMAQLTSGTLDLDRLARLIARYAVHVLGVDRCIIGFFDPRGDAAGRGASSSGSTNTGSSRRRRAGRGRARRACRRSCGSTCSTGRPLSRPMRAATSARRYWRLARRLEARSFITVPLVARERQVGLIYLDTREPRQHSFGAAGSAHPPRHRRSGGGGHRRCLALRGGASSRGATAPPERDRPADRRQRRPRSPLCRGDRQDSRRFRLRPGAHRADRRRRTRIRRRCLAYRRCFDWGRPARRSPAPGDGVAAHGGRRAPASPAY